MPFDRDVKDALQRIRSLSSEDSRSRRARLTRRDFTVVSNDCWGAEVYKDLNLPFATPLIGTYLVGPCFMRLIADCARILRSPLTFAKESRYEIVREEKQRFHWFPTGLLDDGNVEVQFMHYADEAEAARKWTKRVERIIDDRLFVKLSGDKDLFTEADYETFERLPLAHKIALSKDPHPDLPSVVDVPDWTRDGKVIYDRALERFDLVAWLNEP